MESLYTPPPPTVYAPPKSASIPVVDCDPSRAIEDVAADFRIAATEIGFLSNAALFLASDFASWITGEVLSVNGGRRGNAG